ncbi:Zn-dependent exopeptidase [Tilletiaria anomala UBC 951]|uniref:Zn-dependent exopeptidase n=1 Tax=Tilletiaria anomala (strain ATCC 24038 / CBS 436.72 / UBC 951) TaxID=1037660 RepID=A0A066WJA2_TILAU|nr:Zn-dependent exopeptidase [Tilletiaria anomala UBC 951]KDN52638.1 Zn-dependent exopeptidase [Tilletiaria anomala UBC 951]
MAFAKEKLGPHPHSLLLPMNHRASASESDADAHRPPWFSLGRAWIMHMLRVCVVFFISCSLIRQLADSRPSESFMDSIDSIHATLMRHAIPVEALAAARCPQQMAYNGELHPIALPGQSLLAQRLSQAIAIDTSVSDNWPAPAEDPERWTTIFKPFRDWMHTAFPKVHQPDGPVKLELVNQNGLLYTWQGSDESRKPLLLMAHQDVVPVNPKVLNDWIHPPFEGYIDKGNQTIWGRGSYDAKSWLVSIVSTLEALLEAGHVPKRTVVVSFGFDEEASGPQGAAHLGAFLHERYGDDSFSLIVDEGTPVLGPQDPANVLRLPIAMAAVAEKGSVHVSMTVQAKGGHSSFPPQHTSVGLLAKLVSAIEDSQDFGAIVTGTDADYPYRQMQCFSDSKAFPPEIKSMMDDLDWALGHPRGRHALERHASCPRRHSFTRRLAGMLAPMLDSDRRREQRIALARRRLSQALRRYPSLSNPAETTRAVDIFNGGVKVNALPESAEAIIDHRISTSSSVADVKKAYVRAIQHPARSLALSTDIFGEQTENAVSNPSEWKCTHPVEPCSFHSQEQQGHVVVRMWDENELEPAPGTPVVGEDAKPWRFVASVIRRVWQDQAREVMGGSGRGSNSSTAGSAVAEEAAGIRVIPAIMQGNTDTRYMWPLSKHIIRFGPASLLPDTTGVGGATAGVHTTNEHYHADGLVKAVDFYSTLILALEQTTEL